MHGTSAGGAVPLTLQEALAKGQVQVVETGRVNELQIENTGAEQVFIQAGDIVKGGKQDRVLDREPAAAGRAPGSCRSPPSASSRGAGRRAARRTMPSSRAPRRRCRRDRRCWPWRRRRQRRCAPKDRTSRTLRTPRAPRGHPTRWPTSSARSGIRWRSTQRKLSQGLGAAVASPQSTSSLQLSLENEKLKEARAGYIKALQPGGEKDADVVGYVVAINGRMSAANLYPSNALFRKMWEKQLAAVVTEAIGEKAGPAPAATPAPPAPAVKDFLAEAEKGKPYERALAAGMSQEVRDADKSLYNEARGTDGKWIHRSYLAK